MVHPSCPSGPEYSRGMDTMPWIGTIGIGMLVLALIGYLASGEVTPWFAGLGILFLLVGLIIRAINEAGQRRSDEPQHGPLR